MPLRILILGAGFGGLELASILSKKMGNDLDLVLIDKSDAFNFGFSKLDVMFGKKMADEVRIPYESISKEGVQFIRDEIIEIDPVAKKVKTTSGQFEADVLVIALGADYDAGATPGLKEGGFEFYSFDGAVLQADRIRKFRKGHAVVGVTSPPYKCPPAPSEAALLLHEYLDNLGLRDLCKISLVIPFGTPVPPSPDTSAELLKSFKEHNIHFIPNRKVHTVDPANNIITLDDGMDMSFDLFLAIPKHVAPDVVVKAGMTENGWIPVNQYTLRTKYPDVFAIGDITNVPTAKSGSFAVGCAKTVAKIIMAEFHNGELPDSYDGIGSCFIEFGNNRVGKINVDFYSHPAPKGELVEVADVVTNEKLKYGKKKLRKWFGIE